MISRLIRVTILVRDQDEALQFYTEKLGLEKKADVAFAPGMRWLAVAPKDQTELEVVLHKPNSAFHGEEQAKMMAAMIGHQPTGVFSTDDCRKTYETLSSRGVKFLSAPKQQMYGMEAVFQDLYGNTFSLLTPSPNPPPS